MPPHNRRPSLTLNTGKSLFAIIFPTLIVLIFFLVRLTYFPFFYSWPSFYCGELLRIPLQSMISAFSPYTVRTRSTIYTCHAYICIYKIIYSTWPNMLPTHEHIIITPQNEFPKTLMHLYNLYFRASFFMFFCCYYDIKFSWTNKPGFLTSCPTL